MSGVCTRGLQYVRRRAVRSSDANAVPITLHRGTAVVEDGSGGQRGETHNGRTTNETVESVGTRDGSCFLTESGSVNVVFSCNHECILVRS